MGMYSLGQKLESDMVVFILYLRIARAARCATLANASIGLGVVRLETMNPKRLAMPGIRGHSDGSATPGTCHLPREGELHGTLMRLPRYCG